MVLHYTMKQQAQYRVGHHVSVAEDMQLCGQSIQMHPLTDFCSGSKYCHSYSTQNAVAALSYCWLTGSALSGPCNTALTRLNVCVCVCAGIPQWRLNITRAKTKFRAAMKAMPALKRAIKSKGSHIPRLDSFGQSPYTLSCWNMPVA